MYNKIFKTIFISILCMGISLPTNAAVSVSDGSAFVTKAEFSADLNNLSNRMAQLENSLDAKIDSLVSSYLTRNGIWNGAKQEIAQTVGYLSVRYGFTKGSNVTKYDLINYVTSSGAGWSSSSRQQSYIARYNSAATYNLVNSVNKSGMIVFNTQTTNYRQSSLTRCSYGFTSTTGSSANGDHFAFVYTQDFIYWINGSKEGGRAHCEFIATAAPAALRCPQMPSGTVLFFVSKGDKITLQDSSNLVMGNGTGYASSLLWYSSGDNSYSTYDYIVNDAYVY